MDDSDSLGPALEAALSTAFRSVTIDTIRADSLGFSGCSACDVCSWKTPGICAHTGPARDVAKLFVRADICIITTRLLHGTPRASAKALWEHILPAVHPGFVRYRGELHHRLRYPRLPQLACLAEGNHSRHDPLSQIESAIFAGWAERAACNTMSYAAALCIPRGQSADPGLIATLLLDCANQSTMPARGGTLPPLAVPGLPAPSDPGAISPLLILAASGRKNSNSLAIAHWLAQRTRQTGLETLVIDAMTVVPGQLVRSMEQTGHLFVVVPTWHDALPAATIRLFGQLASDGNLAGRGRPLSALVHSGYPEPAQTATALASLRLLALENGWLWAGGLTAGATSVIDGRDPAKAGFFTRHLRRGLTLAVDDLAAGRAISLEAVTAAARPPLPIWLFAKAGNMMVRKKIRSLRKSGTDPDARPFAEERIGQD